jgi:hypothetical protein
VRVVAPYVEFAPGVTEALEATGWPWRQAYVGGSDEAYWELLGDLWADRESFVVVEHDVILRPDTLDELADCPQAWCSFAVPYLDTEYAGLACAKFSDEIIAACPDALDRVGRMSNAAHPPKFWCTVDAWLQVVLSSTSIPRHIHAPALGHYRPAGAPLMPTHGCR